MIIGSKDSSKFPLIFAEIGNNHEGNIENAKKLIYSAADCGVDGVKFQTYKTELFVSQSDKARFNRLKSFELTYDQFTELSELAHSLGLLFISTPLDIESAKFLDSIVDAYKIASGDNNFYPLIDTVSKTKKPLIISSGVSDSDQVIETVRHIEKIRPENRYENFAILHCISCYPVPFEQTNLQAIRWLTEKFRYTIGYSDHSTSIDASLIAVAFGARIIEKHFTLNKSFSSFRDHQLSADPDEMRELVQKIRCVSTMMCGNVKEIQPCEKDNTIAIRRSIAANGNLPEGWMIRSADLIWLRPGGGITPGNENIFIGKKLRTAKKSGDFIFEHDVE